MLITLQRYYRCSKHTKGLLFIDGLFECHTLEDTERSKKMHGQTAIPVGRYEVEKLKVLTPLTQRYRDRFNWFDWHFSNQPVL